jgi:hypothetical protein
MNLFRIETPKFDKGYHKCMERNGEITSVVNYININEISSIREYIGELLHKGWNCSKIKMKNGNEFIDYREVETILGDIKNHNN